MICLPFGFCVVRSQIWDTVVNHVATLLTERCQLVVRGEQDTAIIAVQQKVILAQDAELAMLRSAIADAEELLGL